MATKQTISDVNRCSKNDTVNLLGGLFEHSPWIVGETWPQGPFATVEALHDALCETLDAASAERHLALIRSHPDLVDQAATSGTLTRESTGEQQTAGLGADDLAPGEVELFRRYNAEYRKRFGFPFVICARENRKASILAGFETRLGHDRDTELRAALEEIKRIAWHRLTDLVENEPDTGGE